MDAPDHPEPRRDDPLGGVIVELLAEPTTAGLAARLATVACEQADLERAVIFVWDSALRRARPLGGHAIDPSHFSDFYAAPEGIAFVREAFDRDEVIDVVGDVVEAQTPASMRQIAHGRRVICVPMTARGKRVGLILADRDGSRPPLSAEERDRLRMLGKAVAVALVAGDTTRRAERARQLRQQVDLAREVHDGVVQRLFGVSMALAGDGPLDPESRARCLAEIESVMEELRSAVARPTPPPAPPRRVDLEAELARWSVAHPELRVLADLHTPYLDGPGTIVQTMLLESLRNLRRHAAPTVVEVRSREVDGALQVEVLNDGVATSGMSAQRREAASGHRAERAAPPGVGLRLLSIEALHAGGVVDFGPLEGGRWRVRLTIPRAAA